MNKEKNEPSATTVQCGESQTPIRYGPFQLASDVGVLLTEEQRAWLQRYGQWCRALRDGEIPAQTDAQLHFVRVCFGIAIARTWEEETWLAYQEAAKDFPKITAPERVSAEEHPANEDSTFPPFRRGPDPEEVERTEQYIRAQSQWTGSYGLSAYRSVSHKSECGPVQELAANKRKE